ncbi:ATP-dependent metallopeptidase FtsH/Yme1/Tma family protein [Ruminococcus sp. AF37-6AT]|nr:ATP-dependent metallopeptidase FtsH/Yme1/Tma family protein [Ruminococcus sp. AF13-37]RGW18025.1 ATP-dependent metallopeptidase FtsH/Yme1/Tma family protein [Ruminococcus sp. AF13-28]RHD91113.1 ATP-dependent metallopeptidase FtsH/Yme1/Tma family protein [Ruminococcus sp. AM30-15AC]RHL43196.1 ATP-dependent metallopeptidase FtsH/Yme1/Tma family protein [Ruminococcus sp. AF37-6AT]RHP53394.1 ATP-dependent metallopeptidase FtsH/Yme1/Tma family protein [Ruminococcus sp. AF31-16BH]RHQ61368.1 ATP-d
MDNNPNGNRPDNNKGPGKPDPNKNHQSILAFLVCLLVTLVCFAMFTNMLKDSSSEITYDKFIEMVNDGDVKEVSLQSNTLTITPKHQSSGFSEDVYYTNQMESVDKLTERLEGTGIKFEYKQPDAVGEIVSMLVSVLLPTIVLFVLLMVFMRRMNKGGGMMGVGKSRAKAYIQKDTGITFKDVAGQDEAKESLQEVVDFLHNPGKYTTIGAKLPKGALLVGPPGTGKTLLAKAVAGEAHVPFFSLSGSEFVEMFVGVGASRVRDLFEEAKKNAPCIIFIDEIDAIGKSRDSHYGGGNDEREQTLNQLLAEMDGFDTSKGLLILAATNRPEVLDPALLRPGRFDRRVIVDRPDLKGRIEILKVHARNVHLDETVDFENIALATSGAVGSDLANMINEAAILAVKSGRSAVSQKDLLEAVEVVLVGKEKKDRILSAQERKIVSYHEVGHALVSALQKDAEPVQKITIVPRTMGALGYVMQVPEEEKYLNTKKELEAMLVGYLGGRAAEELVFDTVTTGAANDIEQATKVARAMITQYGMSEKFGLMGLATQENQYLSGRAVLNCGDDTATEVDHEVMVLLHNSYEEAKRLIGGHREALDKIADYLIRRETITGKEFMKIFRAVERGLEIPENLDDLEIPEKTETKPEEPVTKQMDQTETEQTIADQTTVPDSDVKENTVTLDKTEIQ